MDGWVSADRRFVASEPPSGSSWLVFRLEPLAWALDRATIGFSNGTRPADTGQAYPKDAHEQLPHFAGLGDRGVIV
jgi:hypothetical protein